MDPKHIAIIGAGVIGAGALILMGQPSTSQAGGGFGGEGSKKEVITSETTSPADPAAPVYNIVFPDPGFPAIPQAPIEIPWWVTSLDPPATPATPTKPTTKKERFVKSYPYLAKKATAIERIRERATPTEPATKKERFVKSYSSLAKEADAIERIQERFKRR